MPETALTTVSKGAAAIMLQNHGAALAWEERAAPPQGAARLQLAVGIPTAGRPTVLARMLKRLRQQSERPTASWCARQLQPTGDRRAPTPCC
jgi:hypothetical protein